MSTILARGQAQGKEFSCVDLLGIEMKFGYYFGLMGMIDAPNQWCLQDMKERKV